MVYGFGGLRTLGGNLRISPNMPKAWNKLKYSIRWKGQKLAVTATADSVEIVNETGSAPVTVEVWGQEYTFTDKLGADK